MAKPIQYYKVNKVKKKKRKEFERKVQQYSNNSLLNYCDFIVPLGIIIYINEFVYRINLKLQGPRIFKMYVWVVL